MNSWRRWQSLTKTNIFVAGQVKEVYGGEGKVKVKKKNKNRVFSFKYTGPERAAKLLEGDTSLLSSETEKPTV